MKNLFRFLAGIMLLLLESGPAWAGDAVDGINGKLDYSMGSMDSHWGGNFMGSLSVPVSTKFGLQGDALYSHAGNLNFEGGGLHLFWRDSEKGLLGLTAGGIDGKFLYGIDTLLEGQYFLKRFTLGADLGMAAIQYNSRAPFINTHPAGVMASPSLSYYPIDNVMAQAGYSRVLESNLGELLLEYQTPVNGLSCFADLAKSDHGYDHALFGLRFYFGKNKSLIRRHREDDPPNIMQRILTGIGAYGARYNRAAQSFVDFHPGSGSYYTGGSFGVVSYSLIAPAPSFQP